MNANYKLKITTNLRLVLSIVLFLAFVLTDERAAQPPLNDWKSNGPNVDVRTVVVDPFNPNVIYAGTTNGVFKSVNNGATWFFVNPISVTRLIVDHVNPNTLYAISFFLGAFKSNDGGANWYPLNVPGAFIRNLGVSRSNPNHIVAVTAPTSPLNVFVTTNGGTTWETRTFSFPKPDIGPATVGFDPYNPNIIYIFAFNNIEFLGLYKTNNGGVTWEEFNYGNLISWTETFNVSSTNSNIVYAGTFSGVFKSTDGGTDWTFHGRPQTGSRDVNSLAFDPLNPRILYAGVYGDGVFKTSNDGASWIAFNNGLSNLNVRDLAFAPTSRFLHAATSTGVFSARVETLAVNRKADFDGDGRSDISVFRPSDRTWYLNRSTQGFSAIQFGLSTDKLAPADYDGDGKTDISVYRDGTWFWLKSSDNSFHAIQFGIANDIPVPADYTGDGRAELAIYRGGSWWTFNLTSNQAGVVQFGLSTDKPVAADYDGDGLVDQAVYRNGEWHLNRSTQGYAVVNFGLSTDNPVVGDYDGDGKTDQAVYRDGTWHILQSSESFTQFPFGIASDIPAPADYDGDGKTDAAVYRDGVWYLRQSTSGISIQQFGLANDAPVPAAFLP